MEILNEVLDESKLDLPVTNLYPKTKIPQIFSIQTSEEGSLPAFRMCSYTSGGDTNKNVKPGDKMVHVVMLSLNEKGSLVKLKNLGGDPIGVISTTFNIVYSTMKQYKMDACLFRMAKSKIGGQARQMQVIMDRLVRSRTGGKFVILKELWDYDKKYAYILIHRKNVDLSTVPGVPEIDTKLFTAVETKVGEVYVEKKSGQQVTKAQAVAASIATENDKRSDQNVISRAKINRRQAIAAQYSIDSSSIQGDDRAAEEFKRLEAKVPVKSSKGAEPSDMAIKVNIIADRQGGDYMGKVLNFITNPETSQDADGKALAARVGQLRQLSKMPKGAMLAGGFETGGMKYFMENQQEMYNEVRAFARLIAGVNTTNSLQTMKDLVKMAVAGTPTDRREMMIGNLMGLVYKEISANIRDSYQTAASLSKETERYSDNEKQAISEYCANAYEYVNMFLIGKPEEGYSTSESLEIIDNMDSAFEKGTRLDKGTLLYRGQKLDLPTFEHNAENKLFYFRNYVSTSLKPLIFGEFGRMFMALDDETTIYTAETPDDYNRFANPEDIIDIGATQQDSFDDNNNDGTSINIGKQVNLGFVISGVENVRVIVPGSLTEYPEEAEVILPRGTLLKINKITTQVNKRSNKFMVEGAIVPPSEQIDESVELYDGDLFMETGEVVKLSGFMQFINESSYDEEQNEMAAEILSGFLDIDDMPRKFR
ncbi:Alt-like RNA polymerase ADP-ribosyltransferase [Salmonella phage KM16]|uniref:Alt-like RNA polymerase ADP-ribosyltransferase n=1 Tax=Salmonella phage KM16 TaxID=2797303 RepID=UPI0024922F5A|nr:Alt-like RNA polymerase ADP-ribosyltransferase [Salmonella phage KM16]